MASMREREQMLAEASSKPASFYDQTEAEAFEYGMRQPKFGTAKSSTPTLHPHHAEVGAGLYDTLKNASRGGARGYRGAMLDLLTRPNNPWGYSMCRTCAGDGYSKYDQHGDCESCGGAGVEGGSGDSGGSGGAA